MPTQQAWVTVHVSEGPQYWLMVQILLVHPPPPEDDYEISFMWLWENQAEFPQQAGVFGRCGF